MADYNSPVLPDAPLDHLTIRQHFACEFMKVFLPDMAQKDAAVFAVVAADALIAELNKEKR